MKLVKELHPIAIYTCCLVEFSLAFIVCRVTPTLHFDLLLILVIGGMVFLFRVMKDFRLHNNKFTFVY